MHAEKLAKLQACLRGRAGCEEADTAEPVAHTTVPGFGRSRARPPSSRRGIVGIWEALRKSLPFFGHTRQLRLGRKG